MDADFEVLSFEDWKPVNETQKKNLRATRTRRGSKVPANLQAYVPNEEKPLENAWTKLDCAYLDEQIDNIIGKITEITKNARTEDKELVQLGLAAERVRKVEKMKPVEVCLVGQQATGKSLAINALTHRKDLSKCSASGAACTASAIKYVHEPDSADMSDHYDAEIQFMDDETLLEATKEHIRRYYHFHFSQKVDDDYHEEDEQYAETAHNFFCMIFNADNDQEGKRKIESLLTKTEIQSGRLLQETISMAKHRILDAGTDERRVKGFKGMKIQSLMQRIEGFISHHDKEVPMWPIVQYVRILMGSTLLRNGLSLIDCPGLGDLNHSRTAVTNSIRREASAEIIFGRSERVETDELVHQQIKQSIKAHGARNTILVLTKIDEFLLDETAIERIISKDERQPFPLINEYHRKANDAIEGNYEKQEADDEEVDDEDLNKQNELLDEYISYLFKTAKVAYIQSRAKDLETKMRYKFVPRYGPEPITVFSISASMYLEWMKVRANNRPVMSAHETGIPKLRQMLLELPAQGNWQRYWKHVTNELPLFLDKVSRIAEGKKSDAYAVIRPNFNEKVKFLREHHRREFSRFLDGQVDPLWRSDKQRGNRFKDVTKVVHDWGHNVRWNTFNRMLRERGTPFKSQAIKYKGTIVNWNDDICQQITPDVVLWRRKMKKQATDFSRILERATESICRDILLSIKQSSLPRDLRSIAVEEWMKRHTKVTAQSSQLGLVLREQINAVFQYATTETDIRCMISKINSPLYDEIENMPYTKNWYRNQRSILTEKMLGVNAQGKDLLERIADAMDAYARNELQETFSLFMDDLVHEVMLFDEHISERLPVKYHMASIDRQLRDTLKESLPQQREHVQSLLPHFEEGLAIKNEPVDEDLSTLGQANDEEEYEDDDEATKNDYEDSQHCEQPAAKKQKTVESEPLVANSGMTM